MVEKNQSLYVWEMAEQEESKQKKKQSWNKLIN